MLGESDYRSVLTSNFLEAARIVAIYIGIITAVAASIVYSRHVKGNETPFVPSVAVANSPAQKERIVFDTTPSWRRETRPAPLREVPKPRNNPFEGNDFMPADLPRKTRLVEQLREASNVPPGTGPKPGRQVSHHQVRTHARNV